VAAASARNRTQTTSDADTTIQRLEQLGDLPYPAAHRLICDIHSKDSKRRSIFALPVDRQVIGNTTDDGMSQQARAYRASLGSTGFVAVFTVQEQAYLTGVSTTSICAGMYS
jgi:hypothetical protein